METNIINLVSTVPTFKNKALNESTQIIFSAATAYNKTATETRKVIAKALAIVESGKLYKEDGYKSLAEYADKIGLDKSLAHKLENAGRLLNSKDETVKAFADKADYSKLSIMASAGESEVKKAIESGELKADSTQAEVKEWKAAHNASKAESKAKVIPDYKVTAYFMSIHSDGPADLSRDRIALSSPKDFPEAIDMKPMSVVKTTDSAGNEWYTATYAGFATLLYTAERLAKAPKDKPAKPDFSTLDDAAFSELLKEAARRGMKVE